MRRLAPNEFFERGLALARRGWKKAVEGESLRWEAARDQAADCSIRAGNREDVDSGGDGRSGDLPSRVGNPRRAGIADNRNPGPQLQLRRKLLRAGALIVHVIAHGWRVDLEVIQQLFRLARVLTRDAIDTTQDAEGSQGDVFQVSDWRGHKVQPRRNRLFAPLFLIPGHLFLRPHLPPPCSQPR